MNSHGRRNALGVLVALQPPAQRCSCGDGRGLNDEPRS